MTRPQQRPDSMADGRRGDRRRTIATTEPRTERRHSSQALEWLGAEQAVRYLGLPSRKALYQAVRRGQVPVHRLGARRMRFRRSELDQALELGRQPSVLHSS